MDKHEHSPPRFREYELALRFESRVRAFGLRRRLWRLKNTEDEDVLVPFRRTRRGRGPRQVIGLNGSDDSNDPASQFLSILSCPQLIN
jgi:hypothetical protein